MLTFIIQPINHLHEGMKFHVIFQSNTEIGYSNYHFGTDITVEKWDNLFDSIKNKNIVFPIESFHNQNSDVISTKMSFEKDQFIFNVNYTYKSGRSMRQEYIASHIFINNFMEFYQHLSLLRNQRPLL
jgi:hypothetical protein